jgi:hypothetical protein
MSANVPRLKRRKLSAEEIEKSSNKAIKKALKEKAFKDLAEQFIDPETKQIDIAVGEAIAVGEWNNAADAKNFISRHLPGAMEILINDYGWPDLKAANGKRAAMVSSEVHPIDGTGKFEVWIFRTKG